MIAEDSEELIDIEQSHTWTAEYILKTIDFSFKNMLTVSSPQAIQPSEILLPLRPHQRALVHAMKERETASMNGIQMKNTTTYVNYGVLGDEVGTGKSLTVLSYIASLKGATDIIQTQNSLYSNSRKHFFTINKKPCPSNVGPSLIVVPHTIYRQWQEYAKKQTTLNIFFAKSQRDLQAVNVYIEGIEPAEKREEAGKAKEKWLKEFAEYDAVLISNTLYTEIQHIAELYGIKWKRMFIDEVDNISITGNNTPPNAIFTWFITATWPNFVLQGCYIRPIMLDYYGQNRAKFSQELGHWLEEEIGQTVESAMQGYRNGRSTFLHMRSTRWLQSFHSDHILRAIVVLVCRKEFLRESQQMPSIVDQTILCQQSATHKALGAIVSSQIQTMLHAGNIEGALEQLGVSANTSMNLVEAATKEREKELDRLRKTLVFKESMDYATPQTKEAALLSLKAKIKSVEEQLHTFRSRLLNITTEECPICYEDPRIQSATLTPCCHRIFCGGCILKSLSRTMSCPMCRANIHTAQLVHLVEESTFVKKNQTGSKLLSKQKQLLNFLKENPTSRVLVFSRYENPFLQLETSCENEGITHHVLRGNKDAIASTIKSFDKGEKRVLFLPIESGGTGLNLVSATHVVLLHSMTPEEEKQVIGRAYRLGRKDPLHVLRFLHQDETLTNPS